MEENSMAEIENFNLKYSTANKNEITKEISNTLVELKNDYESAIESWETIKNKFTLDPSIKNKLEEIGSANGEENIAKIEFKKIVTSMENLISSLGTVDKSWANISEQIKTAVTNFDVKDAGSSPGGHNVE